jgi:hypothetical protein
MQNTQEYKSYMNLSRGTKAYNLKSLNTSSTLESNLISLTAGEIIMMPSSITLMLFKIMRWKLD